MTAQAAPEGMQEEEKPAEDGHDERPPVTQVVEVVEEDTQTPAPVAVPEETPLAEEELTAESVIRKEKVEELYQGVKESGVMPEISVHKGRTVTSLFVWAVVTILVAILTGGILFSVAKKTSPLKLFARPTATATPTTIPTPTPISAPAAIDKTLFEIQVLNGGGTPGTASKMKTFLEEKGYTVAGTGNTDEYTYTKTEIHGKATMKDAIANLQADLKDIYTIGTVSADLSASASADIQVIVGK